MKRTCLKKLGGVFLREGEMEPSMLTTLQRSFQITVVQSRQSPIGPPEFQSLVVDIARAHELVQLQRFWDAEKEVAMIQLTAEPVGGNLDLLRSVFDVLVQNGCIAFDNHLERYEDLRAGKRARSLEWHAD